MDTRWLCIAIVISLTLASVTHGRYLTDNLDRYRKRSWADQKIAEIKAQMGLRGDGLVIGHGQFDPNMIGRRKRDTKLSRHNFDSMRLRKLREAQSKFIQ